MDHKPALVIALGKARDSRNQRSDNKDYENPGSRTAPLDQRIDECEHRITALEDLVKSKLGIKSDKKESY